MNYQRAHLVCFSPTHTSRRIGTAMLEALPVPEKRTTDLTCNLPDAPIVLEDTLTIVAVPVYAGRVAPVAAGRLESLCGVQSPVVPIVLYGNRDYEDALIELCDLCASRGFTPVAAAAFIGEHSYSRPDRPVAAGRPDASDLQQARSFASDLWQHLSAAPSLAAFPPLAVKGNRPYKTNAPRTPQTPHTLPERCIRCGSCVSLCPVGCITLTGFGADASPAGSTQAPGVRPLPTSDPARCIKCCACVKECPVGARVFDTPFTEFLYRNCSTPRFPELFLPTR